MLDDLKRELRDPETRHKCIVDFVAGFAFVALCFGVIYAVGFMKMWGWF